MWCHATNGGTDSVTWLLLRKLKTFFDQKGSTLLSVGEQKVRERMKADAARYETGELKDDANNDVAYVRCSDVKQQLLAALAAHRDSGQLRQYGHISGSELRCTVLGDKGGAYTKLLLSVWDVVDSQSPKNCILLGMYRGNESYGVINSVFGPVWEQLAALTAETAFGALPSPVAAPAGGGGTASASASAAAASASASRRAARAIRRDQRKTKLRGDPFAQPLRIDSDYLSPDCVRCQRLQRAGVPQTPRTCVPYDTVQLTYGGDMPFLSKLLGISGPAGRHFCTCCTVSETALVTGRAHALLPLQRHHDCHSAQFFASYPPRSLAQATADHKQFSSASTDGGGGGKLENAKLYRNQIHLPLIASEFGGCIAPSPLHVTLGLTQRCFDAYQTCARALDRVMLPFRPSSTLCSDEELYGEERRAAQQLDADRDACEAANQQLQLMGTQTAYCSDAVERWAAAETKRLDAQFKAALKKVTDGEKKLKEIGERINSGAGPFCRAIDTRTFCVARQ
jgi:hypothetical protein